jgi:DNA-binding HxlR family transcriptional regulator
MENLTIDPKTVSDPIALRGEMREALATDAGKWKLEILWLLNQRIHRFRELKRAIPASPSTCSRHSCASSKRTVWSLP